MGPGSFRVTDNACIDVSFAFGGMISFKQVSSPGRRAGRGFRWELIRQLSLCRRVTDLIAEQIDEWLAGARAQPGISYTLLIGRRRPRFEIVLL